MTNLPPSTPIEQQPSLNNDRPPGEVKPPRDPFDPVALRIGAMAADIEVEKVLTAVPVRKPGRTEFFRVNPSPDYTVDMLLLERDSGVDRVAYLVAPEVQHLVSSELRMVRLYTAIDKLGNVFLWPIKLPSADNDRIHRIADTAIQCAEQAKTLWTKMAWNHKLGGYEMSRAKGDLGAPQWPDRSFRDLIEIAFRRYLVDSEHHEVIRELAGEI
jgi:hypothetical protein